MIILNQIGQLPKINPIDKYTYQNIYLEEGEGAYNIIDKIFYLHYKTQLITFDYGAILTSYAPIHHNLLSVNHPDTLAANVVDGDIIIGNVTPKWSRLPISIPAVNVRNVLGIDNGELRPSWKTTLDAGMPETIVVGGAGQAGTSLLYSHKDHNHPAPATWTPSSHTHNSHTSLDVAGNHAKLIPSADSTSAIGVMKNDGTTFVQTWDTTNKRTGINCTVAPTERFDIKQGNINFVQVPDNTATATLANGGAGNVNIGTHRYAVLFGCDDGSWTGATVYSSITLAANSIVNLTNIPVSTDINVTKRRIIRTKAAAPTVFYYLVADISDNVTTNYTDNTSDAGMGGIYRAAYVNQLGNNTAGTIKINGSPVTKINTSNLSFGINAGGSISYPERPIQLGNTNFGNYAGANLYAVAENTNLGYYAGYSDQNGNGNTMIGYMAGYTNGGPGNVVIGRGALFSHYNAMYNTSIGYQSMFGVSGQNATGGIAIGYYTGAYSLGNYNLYIGYQAGLSVNSSTSKNTKNIGIGYQSLYSITTSAGTLNTAIGYQSGYTQTTAANNVFLGAYSGKYETGSNKLIIDGLDRSTEATSRTSALIYGVSNATASSQILSLGGGGKVGIGTTTPSEKLEVSGGNIKVDASSRKIGYWQSDTFHDGYIIPYDNLGFLNLVSTFSTGGIIFKTNSTEKMRITSGGKVGIGTTAPSNQLTQQTTTTLETAPLGSELLSSSGWTSTGWTGDWTTGYTHTVGNTTALTNTLAAVTNNLYQITYTVAGRTAGSFTITFGGVTSLAVSATGTWGPKATSTGTLSITPTSTFDGTIIISIKQITGTYAATYAIQDNTGTTNYEIRNSLYTYYNTFVGKDVGSYNTTGNTNTAIGFQSLYYNTTGYTNTAIGFQSLYYNTTGYYNNAFGRRALYYNTSGYYNNAFGINSLFSNTSGYYNNAFGINSLFSNTTGYSNIAFGINSLYNNTIGNSNNSFGYQSLYSNTTGNSNNAFGTNSLLSNTTGYSNNAFGINSLYNNTTGYSNNAFGINSLYNNTTGYYNNAFGYQSLFSNTTGNYNTAFGYNSGYVQTTVSNNVFYGAYSGRYETAGNKLIIDGLDRSTEAASRTNALIYGVMDTTSANQILSLGGGGKVGIGTTTPVQTLETLGTISAVTAAGYGNSNYSFSSYWGNSAAITGGLVMRNGGANNGAGIKLTQTVSSDFKNSIVSIINSTLNAADLYFTTTTIAGSETEKMRITSEGNVGISTIAPTARLHLPAGTATANTAPLKFTAGTSMTTAEAGAMEYDGTSFYVTRTGTQRETIGTVVTKTTTGDGTGAEGLFQINTFDNTFKVYAEGVWRLLSSW